MMEEDFEDEEGEESESMILSIGKDGKAEIHHPEDYVEMHKDDADLIKAFIDANKTLFETFAKEHKKKSK